MHSPLSVAVAIYSIAKLQYTSPLSRVSTKNLMYGHSLLHKSCFIRTFSRTIHRSKPTWSLFIFLLGIKTSIVLAKHQCMLFHFFSPTARYSAYIIYFLLHNSSFSTSFTWSSGSLQAEAGGRNFSCCKWKIKIKIVKLTCLISAKLSLVTLTLHLLSMHKSSPFIATNTVCILRNHCKYSAMKIKQKLCLMTVCSSRTVHLVSPNGMWHTMA